MLESETDDMPLVEDVHASRAAGPGGSGLVVVEGVWGRAPGGPPPVLIVDDGERRHTLPAVDTAPPDDPTAFRATFSVPTELVDRLGDGLALGVGRTEVPLRLAETGGESGGSWLQGPPLIARRLADVVPADFAEQPPLANPSPELGEDELPMPPRRRFGRDGEEPRASRGSIAAAILRATAPPPEPGATVVERSVIAERRARRSEQLAAVMERRARGAEQSAQELENRLAELEARVADLTADRDRLAGELELQRATAALAQAAREDAEARLANLLEAAPEEVSDAPGDQLAAVRGLPGLEEARRAMLEHEAPERPAQERDDDAAEAFDDALAKLRAGPDELAAVAASVPAPREEPVAAIAPVPVRLREQVMPYVISAEHPRTPWLADAITALDARDRRTAATFVTALLPDQARTVRRPMAYDLDLEGAGALRVELAAPGEGRVLGRSGPSAGASFSLRATPAELAPLVGGGASLWPRGLRVGGSRRLFGPLSGLARRRRRRVTLAELVESGLALDPVLVLRALGCAVPATWTAGHEFSVAVSIAGRDTVRVDVAGAAPLQVIGVDQDGRRSPVVAATTSARAEQAVIKDGWDAVLRVPARGALPLLAQTEPPADEEPAVVLGDLAVVTTLLGWFDRLQGLPPRH